MLESRNERNVLLIISRHSSPYRYPTSPVFPSPK
jgi:hypothetical protein